MKKANKKRTKISDKRKEKGWKRKEKKQFNEN